MGVKFPLYIIAFSLALIALAQLVSIDISDVRSKLGIVDSSRLTFPKPLYVYSSDKEGTISSIEPLCSFESEEPFLGTREGVAKVFKNKWGYIIPIINKVSAEGLVESGFFPPTSIADKVSILFALPQAGVQLPPRCEQRAIEETEAGRVVCVIDTVVLSETSGKVIGVDFKDLAYIPKRGPALQSATCPIKPLTTWRVAQNFIVIE